MSSRTHNARILCAAFGFAAFFALAAFRVVDLGYLSADRLVHAANQQRNVVLALPSERGRILDRHGATLALSVETVAIDADVTKVALDGARLNSLAAALDRTPNWILDRLALARANGRTFASLRFDATRAQADAVAALGVPGLTAKPTRTRLYPHGALAGQLLGFAAVGGAGQAGVEQTYDSFLHADKPTVAARRGGWLQPGLTYPSDRDYTRVSQGATVELTIDAQLQRVVDEALVAALVARGAESGVAVVMDVPTGAILAMSSAPLFDPNDRQQRLSEVQRNRVIRDRFEPGSTLKTFLAAAAIDAGVVWPEKQIYCENGRYQVGRYRISDHKRYGWLSFADVMRYSSNIGVAKVAVDLGAERLGETLRSFGFGSSTGVDLDHEHAGVVPSTGKWPLTTLTTVSYGYGIAVTPIQLVRAYAALANGGRMMRPYVVSQVIDADGVVLHRNEPKAVGVAVSPRTAQIVTEMLVAAVAEGTGTAAQVPGLEIAGKTGTARKIDPETRKYSRRDYLASFVGYFPAHAPRYAVLVMIDRPRAEYYGGAVAAPVFREIAEYLAERTGLRRLPAPVPHVVEQPEALRLAQWGERAPVAMPSYLGLSLREVMTQANRAGWDLELDGSGFVVWQDPPPGASASLGRTLRLRLDDAQG